MAGCWMAASVGGAGGGEGDVGAMGLGGWESSCCCSSGGGRGEGSERGGRGE